jgi:uncharacterized protein involved in response to NO
MNTPSPAILSYAFRPFFLLNGLFAMAVMAAWLAGLHGHGWPSLTPGWHAHELLVGFAMAAIAGFSLTAVAAWTGRPPVSGAPLLALVLCWLLGRLVMGWPQALPAELVGVIDMLFPALLCVLLGREIIGARSRRNYPLLAILVILAALNGAWHLGAAGLWPAAQRPALMLLLHGVLMLVVIIAGRIIPAFTTNWLRQQGDADVPQINIRLDMVALGVTLLTGLAMSFAPGHAATGVLALAAMAVHGYRLAGWRGLKTVSNPLLLVLHAAYAWLPLGYALVALSSWGDWITPAAALHALAMGGIGGMVLAVTTRVALGHTGRPLKAAPATVAAYWILMAAVLLRVVGPSVAPGLLVMDLAAAGWIAAFAIFSVVYWPILTRPRADEA